MNFEIDKKVIEIFYNKTENKKIPVIILNTFSGEGNKVWEECKKFNAKDFILVAISKMSWNNDMTPWECPPLYNGDSYCRGYADKYLKLIENEIIPKAQEFITNEFHKEIEYWGLAVVSMVGVVGTKKLTRKKKRITLIIALIKVIILAVGYLWIIKTDVIILTKIWLYMDIIAEMVVCLEH